jgi:hypothetical protein
MMPAMEDPAYIAAWQDVARRQQLVVVLLALTIATIVLRKYEPGPATLIMQLAMAAAAGAAMVWHTLFRCPRCHNRFFYKLFVRSWTGRRCMHCGLPKNAPFDPDHPPART